MKTWPAVVPFEPGELQTPLRKQKLQTKTNFNNQSSLLVPATASPPMSVMVPVPPKPATKTTQGFVTIPQATTNKKAVTMNINEAHGKFGHVSEQALRATLQTINVQPTGTLRSCDACAMAKAKATKVSKISSKRATIPGERLFVDISGPYKKSIVGSNYWILFVDDLSSKSWIYFVDKRSSMPSKAEHLLTKINGDSSRGDCITKFLRCDNAGENMARLELICAMFKIQIEYTAPNTPQQNGVVERKFATIRDRSCAMMYNAGWDDATQGQLWAESVNTGEFQTNIVSKSRNVISPNKLYSGVKPMIYK
jgi:hypothetical protein